MSTNFTEVCCFDEMPTRAPAYNERSILLFPAFPLYSSSICATIQAMKRSAAVLAILFALFLATLPLFAASPQKAAQPKNAATTEKAEPKKTPQAETPVPACLDCHPDKKEGKAVHPAVEMGCSSCHTGLHQGEKPAPKLASPVPDLCFTCHDKSGFEKKSVHAPVAGGMCLSCHNPHASGVPKLLVAAVPDLCFSCHDKKSLAKMTAHVSAAGGQCLTCHNPHGSDGAFVLNQLVEGHCESCHDEATPRHVMLRISPGDSHPLKGRPDPLSKGKDLGCPSCHNPHASDQQRISTKGLKSPVPLCLRCHKKIMVRP